MRPSFLSALLTSVGLVAAAVTSIAGVVACLTDPPPDLPPQSLRPTILGDSVVPPAGLLTTLPPTGQFSVPIVVSDQGCQFSVFENNALVPDLACKPCESTLNAGVVLQHFGLASSDLASCPTTIRFFVVYAFSAKSACSAADATGGESVEWTYLPPGCSTYDAGPNQDGAFPEADSGLLVTPESGADP